MLLGEDEGELEKIVGIEGVWEEVQSQGSMLAGQHVRVTFVTTPAETANESGRTNGHRAPNTAVLEVLEEIKEIRRGINPKKDTKDYLDEARSGAMYGYGDDD